MQFYRTVAMSVELKVLEVETRTHVLDPLHLLEQWDTHSQNSEATQFQLLTRMHVKHDVFQTAPLNTGCQPHKHVIRKR